MNRLKILVVEIDGAELEYQQEYDLAEAIEYVRKRNFSIYNIASTKQETIEPGQQMLLRHTGIIVDGELNIQGNMVLE